MIYSLPLFIASDHAGFDLKQKLIQQNKRLNFKDLGCFSNKRTDYPIWANHLCQKIQKNTYGVLICGTGQGMTIKANRFQHIRACLCLNSSSAKQAREHNDANVLCLGASFLSLTEAQKILETFLNTSFNTKDLRYKTRVNQL